MNSAVLLNLLFGVALLLLGRKLFWLFVGVAGFLAGMDFADQLYSSPHMAKLLIALVVGIIGSFLALLFYKAAVAVAGFFLGGYLAMHLIEYLAVHPPQSIVWIPYLIGGIIGAVLILLLLDWALIILSSFAGATLIAHSITLKQFNMPLVFIALVIVGIVVQGEILRHSRRTTE